MFIFKKIIILLWALSFSYCGLAQVRQEFWSRITMNRKIDEKWTIGGDVQYRSQENYHEQNQQRFENPLLQSIRTTLYYKIFQKKNISLLVSPLVYFRSFDVKTDGTITDQRELRTAWGVIQQQDIKKIKIRNRLQYEMRFLKVDKPEHILQHRFRWQTQLTIPIWKAKNKNWGINYVVFDEFFWALQKRKSFFEQNRFYNALQIKYKWTEWNIGLQKSVQNMRGDYIARNQWHLSATIVLD